jgi:hypothetical protein
MMRAEATAMFNGLLLFFGECVTSPGWHMVRIARAMERPPVAAAAQRYRVATFCLFMAMAFLFLSAAIVLVTAGPVFASEFLGCSGVVAMHACAFCGLRFDQLNRTPITSRSDQSETGSD